MSLKRLKELSQPKLSQRAKTKIKNFQKLELPNILVGPKYEKSQEKSNVAKAKIYGVDVHSLSSFNAPTIRTIKKSSPKTFKDKLQTFDTSKLHERIIGIDYVTMSHYYHKITMDQLGRKMPETTKTSRNNDIKEVKESTTTGSGRK